MNRATRLPPNDNDAEKSVLGACLLSCTALGDATETGLLPEHFYSWKHQAIFTAITEIRELGRPVDSITVADHIRTSGILPNVDPLVELQQLQNETPTISNAAHYSGIVIRCALGRRLIQLGVDITDMGFEIDGSVDRYEKVIESTRAALDGFGTASGSSPRFRRWSITDLLNEDLTYRWDALGMLIRPTYGVDSGELKTLKSYFGIARMIGLAAGVPILGRWAVPERRRVLAVVAEGGRISFTRRLRRLCELHEVDPVELDGWLEPVFDAAPLDSPTFRSALRTHLDDFAPAFVHLDPLYAFMPATVDTKVLSQVGAMLSDIQALCAERDASFWITAHMNQTGIGFDLKRITGAGVGEWGDSWTLLRHRADPDVGAGKFRLELSIGSRQWGGGNYEVDFDIGRFDPDAGIHDGPIVVRVRTAEERGTQEPGSAQDVEKRLLARRLLFLTLRRARTDLDRREVVERTTGVSDKYLRAEFDLLVEDGQVEQVGLRKPTSGGHDVPIYRLSKSAGTP